MTGRTLRSILLRALALSFAAAGATRAGPVGFELVKDFDAAPGNAGSSPHDFVALDGEVYFAATEPETGEELYVSDGGATPARRVTDLARGTGGSSPLALGRAGGKLIVDGTDGLRGEQLWAVDPVSGARERLTNAAYSSGMARLARPMAQFGDRLVFEQQTARDLWITNGTPQGTRALTPGPPWTGRENAVCALPDRLVIARPVDSSNHDILVSDGDPASNQVLLRTTLLDGLTAFQHAGVCYFAALSNYYDRWMVWRSDGTAAGTQLVREVSGVRPGAIAQLGGALYVADSSPTAFRVMRVDTGESVLSLPAGTFVVPQLQRVGTRLAFLAPFAQPGANALQSLYVSDGTSAGTRRLDWPAGFIVGSTLRFHAVGERLLTSDAAGAVWAVDPASGTFAALGTHIRLASGFAAVDGDALFAAVDARGEEVWRSDGSVAGTRRVHDVHAPTADGFSVAYAPRGLVLDPGTLLFARAPGPADAVSGRYQLWRTDGSDAGTRALPRSAYDEGDVVAMARYGNGAVFATEYPATPRSRFYATDGQLVAATPFRADDQYFPKLTSTGDDAGVLFVCDAPFSPMLCALHGGSLQPAALTPGLSWPQRDLFPVGRVGTAVLFFVPDAFPGDWRGLWRSDGTAAGTQRLAADLIHETTAGRERSQLLGGRLLFHACQSSDENCGLYASDGTAAGTHRIVDLPGHLVDIAPLGDRVAILRQTSNTQLLISDGTTAGTRAVFTQNSSGAMRMASTGDRVQFAVRGAANDAVYYVSDGSAEGTRAVTLPAGLRAAPEPAIALDADTVVFACASAAIGTELCVADAAATDVRLLRDLYPGTASSSPVFLGSLANGTYAVFDDGRHGRELWRLSVLSDALFADDFSAATP